jgi:hypothetical protein
MPSSQSQPSPSAKSGEPACGLSDGTEAQVVHAPKCEARDTLPHAAVREHVTQARNAVCGVQQGPSEVCGAVDPRGR